MRGYDFWFFRKWRISPEDNDVFFWKKISIVGFGNGKKLCSVYIDGVWGHVQGEVIEKKKIKKKERKWT